LKCKAEESGCANNKAMLCCIHESGSWLGAVVVALCMHGHGCWGDAHTGPFHVRLDSLIL
jgi:hypothetical protein